MNEVDIGITRNEDGSSDVEPITGQECPKCGYSRFWSTLFFPSDWMPTESSKGECPECETVYELVAKPVED